MRKTFTVGISGGSGSGKTYFLNKMATHFDRLEICSISMDHYYKPREVQSIDENGVKNFDLPEAIDHKSFVTDIRRLKNGETLTKIEYTFNNPKSIPGSLTFRPAPLLLIEGLFVQYFEEVNSELDLRVFIESHNHLKLERRIRRDREERGYDLNDVLYRYERHTLPVYEQLIAPLQAKADFLIHNNHDFDPSINILAGYLKLKIGSLGN